MNTEENIGCLVCRLSDLRDEYQTQYTQAQEVLQDYVTSTCYPITDRFEVWTEWCVKENYRRKINEADVPFFGKIVDDPEFCEDFFPHEVYDWLYFLELFDDTSEGADIRERYKVTSDDIKELFIKHNFGSFRMDW